MRLVAQTRWVTSCLNCRITRMNTNSPNLLRVQGGLLFTTQQLVFGFALGESSAPGRIRVIRLFGSTGECNSSGKGLRGRAPA
jgi:hypothetical protein